MELIFRSECNADTDVSAMRLDDDRVSISAHGSGLIVDVFLVKEDAEGLARAILGIPTLFDRAGVQRAEAAVASS